METSFAVEEVDRLWSLEEVVDVGGGREGEQPDLHTSEEVEEDCAVWTVSETIPTGSGTSATSELISGGEASGFGASLRGRPRFRSGASVQVLPFPSRTHRPHGSCLQMTDEKRDGGIQSHHPDVHPRKNANLSQDACACWQAPHLRARGRFFSSSIGVGK